MAEWCSKAGGFLDIKIVVVVATNIQQISEAVG